MSVVSPKTILTAIQDWGVTAVRHNGWPNFTSAGGWDPHGIVHHHTAIARSGLTQAAYVALNVSVLSKGYVGLPPPLCQFAPAPDGRLHLIGWANCNHAGWGDPRVLAQVKADTYNGMRGTLATWDGNPDFYGLEYMSPGTSASMAQWPEAMLVCGARTAAAICQAHGWTYHSNIEHFEWTDRKVDRSCARLGTERIRPRVAALLAAGPHPKPWPTPLPVPVAPVLAWGASDDED